MSGSSKDGGVGRTASFPCTTKRRITTNLKTKNNQNCQRSQTAWKSNNQEVKEETFIQTGMPRQRNMGQMKEQIKTLEKELSDEEIDNLADTEFKTLVIRVLTELTELDCKMKEEMKATQSEIKQNIQGTNSEGKETGIQINDLKQKEERSIRPEQNEEKRIKKKNEERLSKLQDNTKSSNIQIMGVPEGEEEEQDIENVFENIMKENFPSLVKELDMQVQETQRVSKKLDPRRNTPIPKIKDKERILKAARGKETVSYKGVPIRPSADFSKENLQARRGWKELFKVMKGKDLHPR